MKKTYLSFLVSLIFASLTFGQDIWSISNDMSNNDKYYGATMANGMIGFVPSSEPLKTDHIVMAGTYDKYGRGGVDNYFDGIHSQDFSLKINNVTVSSASISKHRQTLDMKRAAFIGSFSLEDKADIIYEMRALRQMPYSTLITLEIKPKTDIDVEITNEHFIPDALHKGQMSFRNLNRKGEVYSFMTTQAMSPNEKVQLASTSVFLLPGKDAEKIRHYMPDNNRHYMKYKVHLKAGEDYKIGLVSTMTNSSHCTDVKNESDRLTIFAAFEGTDRLISRHTKLWEDLWNSDIEIYGDKQLQQDVHNMLYNLYSSVREGSRLSLSPMGLSGLGYNGHVFWDSEIWIYPALLVLHPEMALSLIDYRIDRYSQAKKNAVSHGYKGAMYPWESSDTGYESTPVWAFTGPSEHHITACIAIAIWNYYCVTQDIDWLSNQGYPIIKGCADFWVSRAEKESDGWHIKNVVCADEWAIGVDDNAFTNGAAKVNLNIAIKAAQKIAYSPDRKWQEVADNLVILKGKDGVTLEHASYKGENIKQADVNLLSYPLNIIKKSEQTEKDLNYYITKVPEENTPAMTKAIFSLLYARLGNKEKASFYLKGAYINNLCPPFRTIAEFKNGTNPYFVTGAGGVLQAIMMGFAGLEITDEGIKKEYKGILPSGCNKIILKGIGLEKKEYQIK
jgi:Trehalose and maltose hydrolases (possible phosphorylases)